MRDFDYKKVSFQFFNFAYVSYYVNDKNDLLILNNYPHRRFSIYFVADLLHNDDSSS